MKRKIVLIFVCICMCLTLTACSTEKKDEMDDTKKHNAYIDLTNFIDGWLQKTTVSYFNTFGGDEELDIDKKFKGFNLGDAQGKSLYEVHKDQHTQMARKYQSAKPLYGEADNKMKILCDKTESFIELYLKDVNEYYSKKEYEKDNFAKGQELHKKMLVAYDELIDARNDFHDAFFPKMREMEAKDLKEYQENGHNIRYYTLSAFLEARNINDLFDNLDDDGKLSEADLKVYEEMYTKFNLDIAELTKIYKDSKQQKKEDYSPKQIKALLKLVSTLEAMQKDTAAMLAMFRTDHENGGRQAKINLNTKIKFVEAFDKRMDNLVAEYNRTIDL